MAISHYYPTPGGTERQAHQLARALIGRGHEVRVLTMRHGPGPAMTNIEGVPIYRAIHGIQRGALFGLSYLLTATVAILRLGRDAEVLHTHHLYLDAIAAVSAARILRVPTLAKVACGGAVGDLARLRQTEAEVRAAGFHEGRVVRIHNGVDISRFAPTGAVRTERSARTVLFLGRLDPQKGVNVLLGAWDEVAFCKPDTTLVIGGVGPEEAALRAAATRPGLAGRVRFLGAVPDPEAHLRTAAAFVLPSWHEGLPNALLEAMATGLPCVATAIGGTTDVATEESDALLVPPGDAAALAKALLRILTDADLAGRLGAAARRRVVADFSLDTTVTRYEQVYREMRDAA
jgi:glycosyltransferase involved in cell wall biosynthesis